jgi:putative ABC transport system permease protein
MLAAFGVDIPAGGTVFEARTAVVALVVGIVVTVGSAVFPSLRASRIPPIAALRDVAIEQPHASRRRLVSGGAVTVLGLAAFVAGLAGSGIGWVGLGALVTFVGVFMLGPLVARPVARVLGAPLPAVSGVTGALARENAMRNPKRTARTGGALMVGVALVSAITVIAASAKDWVHDIYDEQFSGDFVVSTDTFGFGGISPDLAAGLNELPEVDTATGVRAGVAHIGTGDSSYVAIDPATAGRMFDIGMIHGSLEGLTTNGLLVDDDEAAKRHIGMGDHIDVRLVNGTTHRLTVEGIYTEQDLAGPFVVSHALHEQSGADQFDFSVYITKAPEVRGGRAEAAIARLADAYPNATLESRAEYVDAQAAQVDQLVNLMYGLLGLAVVIALVSIANSMALSIYERTREIGLLRAVGMTRAQTRRSVRWEAVLISLLGASLGVVVGIFFGWAISVTIRGAGLGVATVPVGALVVIVLLAVLGGILAAMRPAWRAAHVDMLRAIATE